MNQHFQLTLTPGELGLLVALVGVASGIKRQDDGLVVGGLAIITRANEAVVHSLEGKVMMLAQTIDRQSLTEHLL